MTIVDATSLVTAMVVVVLWALFFISALAFDRLAGRDTPRQWCKYCDTADHKSAGCTRKKYWCDRHGAYHSEQQWKGRCVPEAGVLDVPAEPTRGAIRFELKLGPLKARITTNPHEGTSLDH